MPKVNPISDKELAWEIDNLDGHIRYYTSLMVNKVYNEKVQKLVDIINTHQRLLTDLQNAREAAPQKVEEYNEKLKEAKALQNIRAVQLTAKKEAEYNQPVSKKPREPKTLREQAEAAYNKWPESRKAKFPKEEAIQLILEMMS